MKLTKIERQILYNQYEILSILCPEEKESLELKKTILCNGYASEYSEILDVDDDELDEDKATFVYDVLEMYHVLYFSYEELDDKSGISSDDVLFKGFDGNNENEYRLYASFLIKYTESYKEFENIANNSHARRVGIYKKMLDVYNDICNNPNTDYPNFLSKENISSIINASKRI